MHCSGLHAKNGFIMNDMHFKTVVTCSAIILAVCAVLWDKMFVVIPAFLLFMVFGFYKKYFGKIYVLVTIFFFVTTIFYTNVRIPIPDAMLGYADENVTIEGMVSSFPSKSIHNKTKFSFDVNKLTDKNNNSLILDAKTQVFMSNKIKTDISRGDYLRIKAKITSPNVSGNEGEFDYAKYLANMNIFTLSFAKDMERLDIEPSFCNKGLRYLDKIREKIILEHKKHLSADNVEILGGVVFGSEAIKPSPELKDIFINSGLYHLLAASGMNVAFIFGIWFFILIKLRVPYNFIIVSGGLVVLFYALMTGLPPSVTRATWMLELGLLGKLIDRKADNSVILLFVCAILLVYNPMLINDIGFQLSFMVTFGLLTCSTPIMEKLKFIPQKISGWFVIPFVAQLFAIPIQIYYFQTISLYSILANMLVIPFMAVISFCGFVSSILALIPKFGTYFCMILDKINLPFLTFLHFVAEQFSLIPNNIAQVAKLNYIEIILYYLLIFIFIHLLKNNFKDMRVNIFAVIILISLSSSIALKSLGNDLTFTFLNVGEADSIFIKTPNDKKILVDTGKVYGKTKNSATSVIIPYLKVLGINSIDVMLLTHPDTDHIGGSVDILENIKVDKVITNGEVAHNKSYIALENYLKTHNVPSVIINDVTDISPDKDISIVALKPEDTNKKSQNDTSIILIFKYKDFDAILMGDNEANSYNMLKENLSPSGEIELFKIGHHGSSNAINQKMADFISPSVTIISVGQNAYGHPHPNVLKCLRGSRIYRTDLDNTVKIKANGKKFDVYTYDAQKTRWCKDIRSP